MTTAPFPLDLLATVCLAGAVSGCVYLIVATIAVLYFPARRSRCEEPLVPVSVLKPLHGAEPGLSARLAAFCRQAYPASVQVVCGVRDHGDPAAVEVAQLCEVHAETIELSVNPHDHGCNRKVSNLTNMLVSARYDVIVLSDSDIEVGPDYLREVVAHLHSDANVGAVTCLYHGVAAGGRWSQHSALAINGHLLPSIVTAVSLGLARPCFGATIALRRGLLRHLGGFESFADQLADDYAIGAAVRAAGYKVAIPAFSVGHLCFVDSLPALLAQELRAARTIRSINPVGYAGTLITHPFALALIAAFCEGGDAAPLAIGALALRGLLCAAVQHKFRLARQSYALLPARELLSFAVFVLSYCGATVRWRGFAYRVAEGGKLVAGRAAKDAQPAR